MPGDSIVPDGKLWGSGALSTKGASKDGRSKQYEDTHGAHDHFPFRETTMIARPLVVPTLLVASVSVPYAVTNSGHLVESISWAPSKDKPWSSLGDTKSQDLGVGDRSAGTVGTVPSADGTRAPGSAHLQPNIAQAFNLGVTMPWVYSTWHRKSTGLADRQWTRNQRAPSGVSPAAEHG